MKFSPVISLKAPYLLNTKFSRAPEKGEYLNFTVNSTSSTDNQWEAGLYSKECVSKN